MRVHPRKRVTTLLIAMLVAVCAGAAMLIWMRRPAGVQLDRRDAAPAAMWTADAGDYFGNLSESARCDLVFAVSALDDDRSRQLLVRALDDPSETVALAAAHALARRGDRDAIAQHNADHPGERAQRLTSALELLTPD